jgi:coenzyme F420-reducing hydrogenase beta subunit
VIICEKENCYGCSACYAACPRIAITMQPDAEGFLYPQIDEQLCSSCQRCLTVCKNVHAKAAENPFPQTVYACYAMDATVRRNSSSGGAFYCAAKHLIENGGCVFAVVVNEKNVVEHRKIADRQDLKSTQGSKYVQSKLDDTFLLVAQALQANQQVLFSGTPCQVAGLNSFLGKPYQNLITCDVVCHGVPSPRIWSDYLAWLEKRYQDTCRSVHFRSKRIGWHCFSMVVEFTKSKPYNGNVYRDPFHRGFLRNLYLRPSCHNCVFTNTNRPADITLADYWGFNEKNGLIKYDDKGISMFICNTSAGQALLDAIREQMVLEPRDMVDALKATPCLKQPFPLPAARASFWHDYQENDFDTIVHRYLYPDKDAFTKRLKWTYAGKIVFRIKKRIRKYAVRLGLRT